MEFSLIADTVAVYTAKQSILFGKSLANQISLTVDRSPIGIVQVSAVLFPVDSIASPLIRSSSYKTIRRIRKKRRTKRVLFGGDSEDGRFLLEGDFGGNDGPFGGGDGGSNGGGKGWNFGGGGGNGGNWDESSSSWSWSDPAIEFIYEVISWIALSNCLHFAFKRIVTIVTNGEREKLNITLSPVC